MRFKSRKIILVVALGLFVLFCFSASWRTVSAATIRSAPINGLVGYWSFDANAMGTTSARDLSGNNNTGWLIGEASKQKGKLGQGINLDGSTGYVNVGTGPSLALSGDFTTSLWVKISTMNAFPIYIIGNRKAADQDIGIELFAATSASNGILGVQLDTGVDAPYREGTTNIRDDRWHHVVATRSGENIYVFVDGIREDGDTVSGSGVITTDTSLYLGRTSGANDSVDKRVNGNIDDVRIYNRALSAAEVYSLYRARGVVKMASVNLTGLVGWWRMDEVGWGGTSGEVRDSSSNKKHGTAVGGATTGAGKFSNAGVFNGSSGYVSLGTASRGEQTSGITISAWVNLTNYNDEATIVARDATSNRGYIFRVRSTNYSYPKNLEFIIYGDTSATTYRDRISSLEVPLGQWTHVVGTYDVKSGTVTNYINGVASSIYYWSNSSGFSGSTADLRIGMDQANGDYFIGSIDDVRIYDRALSQSEITQLYSSQVTPYVSGVTHINASQTYIPPTSTTDLQSGLVGFWTFDGKNMGTTSAYDASGNGNTGWLMGGVKKVIGKVGSALQFNGSSGYVYNLNTPSIAGGNNVTYSAWIYPKDEAADGNYFATVVTGDTTQAGWSQQQCRMLWVNPTGATASKFYMDCGTDNDESYVSRYTNNTYAVNRWYLVTGIFSNGTIHIYVNGVLDDGTLTSGGTSVNTNANKIMAIGALVRYDNSLVAMYFPGFIDEVRIYNRALNAAEVQKLYRLGR